MRDFSQKRRKTSLKLQILTSLTIYFSCKSDNYLLISGHLKIKFLKRNFSKFRKIPEFSSFFSPRLQHNLESKSGLLREFCLFRSSFESWRQEIQQFQFKIHLKLLNHTQYCGKVWKMPDMCQHKLEENWVHSGNIGEGGKAPSQTLSNLTHMPSILWKYIWGIVSTFPQSWVWFRSFKWILNWNCWISWRQLSKLLLNKQNSLKRPDFDSKLCCKRGLKNNENVQN